MVLRCSQYIVYDIEDLEHMTGLSSRPLSASTRIHAIVIISYHIIALLLLCGWLHQEPVVPGRMRDVGCVGRADGFRWALRKVGADLRGVIGRGAIIQHQLVLISTCVIPY